MAFWGFNWLLSGTPLLAGAFSLTAFLSGPLFFTGLIRMAVDGWKGPYSRWFIAPLAAICVLHPLYVLVGRAAIEKEWSQGAPLLADHQGDVIFVNRGAGLKLSQNAQNSMRFSALFFQGAVFRSNRWEQTARCIHGCVQGQKPSIDAVTVSIERSRLLGIFPVKRLQVEDGPHAGRSLVVPGVDWIYDADLIPFTMSFGCADTCQPMTLRFLPKLGMNFSNESERMMVEGL